MTLESLEGSYIKDFYWIALLCKLRLTFFLLLFLWDCIGLGSLCVWCITELLILDRCTQGTVNFVCHFCFKGPSAQASEEGEEVDGNDEENTVESVEDDDDNDEGAEGDDDEEDEESGEESDTELEEPSGENVEGEHSEGEHVETAEGTFLTCTVNL